MDKDTYRAAVEAVAKNYESRIAALLADAATTATRLGWVTDGQVEDMTADDFQWRITLKPARLLAEATAHGVDADEMENVDVTFKIEESLSHKGTTAGINFSFEVAKWSGEVLGGILPYNYSSQVWVDVTDADAVEERFEIIENNLDISGTLPEQDAAVDKMLERQTLRRKLTRYAVVPHSRCEHAGHCVEHERDPSVKACRIVTTVCSVGGCWEPRVPGTEFCKRGPSHQIKR